MLNKLIHTWETLHSSYSDNPKRTRGIIISILLLPVIVSVTIWQLQYRQDQQSGASVGVAAITNCDVSSNEIALDSNEQSLLQQVNQYRQQNGVSPLVTDAVLNRAAAWFSKDLSINNARGHVDSLGRDPAARTRDCGYAHSNSVGENTGSSPTATGMLDWWKGSSGHNQQILNTSYKTVGVGNTGNRWVLVFSLIGEGSTQPTPTPSQPQQPTMTLTPSSTPKPSTSLSPTSSPSGPTPTRIPEGSTTVLNISATMPFVASSAVMPTTIQVLDIENKVVFSEVVQLLYNRTQFSGQVDLGTAFATGYYTVKMKGHNTLQKNSDPFIQYIENKNTTTLPAVPLVVGDLNNDNQLTISDFTILFSCMVDAQCVQKVQADINFDGEVNIQDYSIMLESFANVKGN